MIVLSSVFACVSSACIRIASNALENVLKLILDCRFRIYTEVKQCKDIRFMMTDGLAPLRRWLCAGGVSASCPRVVGRP